jgi:hypothetical protein
VINYVNGSLCPFPRKLKHTTAIAIATPIAAPYAATEASANLTTYIHIIGYKISIFFLE